MTHPLNALSNTTSQCTPVGFVETEERVGEYIILGELGEGGNGKVNSCKRIGTTEGDPPSSDLPLTYTPYD